MMFRANWIDLFEAFHCVSKQSCSQSINFATDKPSPPRNLAAVEIDKEQVTVTWEPSEDDGGEPITAYTVERRDVEKQTWIKVGPEKIICRKSILI